MSTGYMLVDLTRREATYIDKAGSLFGCVVSSPERVTPNGWPEPVDLLTPECIAEVRQDLDESDGLSDYMREIGRRTLAWLTGRVGVLLVDDSFGAKAYDYLHDLIDRGEIHRMDDTA